MRLTDGERREAVDFFTSIQDRLGAAFEQLDGRALMARKPWTKDGDDTGGGTIGVLRGEVVEKAGANVSAVRGDKYPAIEGEYAGKPFFAAGVSTICHMYNPYAPIGHMNVRLIEVGETFWFGGGADFTPCFRFEEDVADFHAGMAKACTKHGPDSYAKFKAWCDEYFYIPHRQSIRGAGGIFFDYQKGAFAALFPFVRAVAEAYVDVYPAILARRKDTPFTPEDKETQLHWRGRYAEFNLIYDRGTRFGLMSGGNTEAIFVSLPPVVKW